MRQGLLIAAILLFSSSLASADSQGDPRLDYILQCQGCHQPDGSGAEALGVPRMTGFVGRFLAIEGGRAYLVQVPGVAQSLLGDQAIAELLNWLLVRFSPNELPEPFTPYTKQEVARYRARTPIDAVETRAALVAAMKD